MRIKGNTIGFPNPQANLAQTDPTQADYVHGKELVTLVATDPNNDGRIVLSYGGNISGEVLPSAEGVRF